MVRAPQVFSRLAIVAVLIVLAAFPLVGKLAAATCNCLTNCFPQYQMYWISGSQYWSFDEQTAYTKVPHDTPSGVTINNLRREQVPGGDRLMQTRYANGTQSCTGEPNCQSPEHRTALSVSDWTGGPWEGLKYRCVAHDPYEYCYPWDPCP